MLNKNKNEEEGNNNKPIKIEEVELNPDRNTFENELRREYSKEDINNYFNTINENKILCWENKLLEYQLPIRDFSNVTDPDILNEKYHDIITMRIIKGDIERTRVYESLYMHNFKEYLYQIIIYYLNRNKIAYKQGLNEIAAPFILLKYKLKISFTRIYKMLVCFIDKFLTNYYHEKEFFSLRSSYSLINLLLRYHIPEIFDKFEYFLITPDLYATPWIITLFSIKCNLNVLYYLWDKIILFDDVLFPHFFITAYLMMNKDKFLNVDSSLILTALSKLQMESIEEVIKIINVSVEIKDKTPNSIYLLSTKLEIFNYYSTQLESLYNEYKPNKMLALPMFANDIFCITYKNLIGCPDENCENFLKPRNFNNLSKCIYCRDRQLKKKISYIIFDLRIFEKDENENIFSANYGGSFPGFLPKSLRISKEQLNDENFPENILKDYKNEKDNYHFILITSETNYFKKYEKEFYKKSDKRNSKLGVFFKDYKELNVKKVEEVFHNNKNKNKKEYILFKEYDNFKKIIKAMNKEGFKYVSYIYGGYKEIHSFAMKYKIDLLGHGPKCFLCQKEPKQKENNFSFFRLLSIKKEN